MSTYTIKHRNVRKPITVRDISGRFSKKIRFSLSDIEVPDHIKVTFYAAVMFVTLWVIGYALSVAPLPAQAADNHLYGAAGISAACAFAKAHPHKVTDPYQVIEDCI